MYLMFISLLLSVYEIWYCVEFILQTLRWLNYFRRKHYDLCWLLIGAVKIKKLYMFLCCGGNSPLMFIVRSNSTATLVTALIANKLFLYFMHSHTVDCTTVNGWTSYYINCIAGHIKIIWRNFIQLKTHPDIC